MSIPVLAAVCLGAEYMLYSLVFRYPEKRRPDAHHIPESALYRTHRDSMRNVVKEAEIMPHEEICIRSRDGFRLYGQYYAIKKDAPLMIFFHGYHGVPSWDGYGFFKICRDNGMNLLMVDERAREK